MFPLGHFSLSDLCTERHWQRLYLTHLYIPQSTSNMAWHRLKNIRSARRKEEEEVTSWRRKRMKPMDKERQEMEKGRGPDIYLVPGTELLELWKKLRCTGAAKGLSGAVRWTSFSDRTSSQGYDRLEGNYGILSSTSPVLSCSQARWLGLTQTCSKFIQKLKMKNYGEKQLYFLWNFQDLRGQVQQLEGKKQGLWTLCCLHTYPPEAWDQWSWAFTGHQNQLQVVFCKHRSPCSTSRNGISTDQSLGPGMNTFKMLPIWFSWAAR